MLTADQMGRLISIAAYGRSADETIEALAAATLELVGGRNVLVAIVDPDLGLVSVKYGSGADIRTDLLGRQMNVDESAGEGIVAAVAARGQSILLDDVRNDPRYREMFKSSRSEIAVPVRDRSGHVRAVLNVESDQEGAYGRDQQRSCEMIANLLAMVIDRDDRVRRETAIAEVVHAYRQSDTEAELIAKVMEVADGVLELHAISVFIYDANRNMYVLRGSTGALRAQIGVDGYAPNEGLTGWVCAEGQPLLVQDPSKDPRWRGTLVDFPEQEIKSYLAVPILLRGQCVGAIRALRRRSENRFINNQLSSADQFILQIIAGQLGAGLENIRAIHQAVQTERMAAWGEMSAKSSHMIGNRVFAVKGDVNEILFLLDQKPIQVEELREIAASLKTNLSRVDEILQEFRDYLSAAQVTLVRSNINALVEDSVKEVFPRRSQIELKWDLQEELPEVEIDPTRMRRAISEVVENALSFYDSGVFLVRTRTADPEMVKKAGLFSISGYVQIEFEDQGPGVDAAQKRAIFQPFFSSRVKGMGLGLSIVKGILDAHGGTVMEVGEAGTGARFVFLLPVVSRPKEQ